jgi:hypothetical protein
MKRLFSLMMLLFGAVSFGHADQMIDEKITQYDSFPNLTAPGVITKAYEFHPEFSFNVPGGKAQFISSSLHLIANQLCPVFQTFNVAGVVTSNINPSTFYGISGFMNSTVLESNTSSIPPLLQNAFYDGSVNLQNAGSGDTFWLPISFLTRPEMTAKDGATLKMGPAIGLFRKPSYKSGVGSYVEASNYGVWMSDAVISGSGTVKIPLNAGLWVDNLVKGQDNYSVYSVGDKTKFLNEGPMLMKGSQNNKRTAVNDQNYTVTNDDYIIAFTGLSTNRTLTLPAPEVGRILVIKKEIAGTRAIILKGTCDGIANKQISAPYDILTIYADGSAWYSI